jgi:hypothetical protein
MNVSCNQQRHYNASGHEHEHEHEIQYVEEPQSS